MANHGLADLAMYEGKWAEAGTILQAGMAEDEKSNNRVARSAKLIALAEVRLAEGQNAQALTAIKEALAIREDATLVPAALVQLKAGRTAEARAIADELTKQFQPRSRAYGAIVQAEIARSGGRLVEGMDMLAPAQKLADLWLGRYVLGVINVEAGRYPAALGELNQCLKRQGETTAVFFDDMPTLRMQAPLKVLAGARPGGAQQRDRCRRTLPGVSRSSTCRLSRPARRRRAQTAGGPLGTAAAAGSTLFVPQGTWHGGRNSGSDTLKWVAIYSPSGFEGYFREIGRRLPDDPPRSRTAAEREALDKRYAIRYQR